MIIADDILGRLDEEFSDRGEVELIRLDDDERKRSRIRTTTDAGTDVGLILGGRSITEGDVVYADDDRVIAVAFEERRALVVDLSGVEGGRTDLVELGHMIGNRHREIAVRGAELLLPVEDAADPTEDAVRTHLPEGASARYETVPPSVFDASTASGHHDHHHSHGHANDRSSEHRKEHTEMQDDPRTAE